MLELWRVFEQMSFDWYIFKKQGLHYLNRLLSEEQWKMIYLLILYTFIVVGSLSMIMAVTGRGGFLYSSMRLPVWQNLMVLSEDINLPARDHPEQGMHWTTAVLYCFALIYVLTAVRQRKFTRLHGLCFTICLSVGMWLFPFEWVYVPLLDYFHNAPVEGFFSTTLYGLWRNPLQIIANSVIGRNGFMACGILFAHIIAVDNYHLDSFWHSFRKLYRFNRISLLLALSWIGMFGLWIALPAITPIQTDREMVAINNYTNTFPNWTWTENLPTEYRFEGVVKGTEWFPQCIYVWYGKHPDNPDDLYDIIYEEWHPNNLIRSINIITKILTVSWCCYTFIPKKTEKFANE